MGVKEWFDNPAFGAGAILRAAVFDDAVGGLRTIEQAVSISVIKSSQDRSQCKPLGVVGHDHLSLCGSFFRRHLV